MNLAELQRYAANPNVRKMFDLVAYTEGVQHGYNTMFGNQRFDNLSAHPNVRKQFKQTDGKMNVTTAAGRYQFLKPTWDGLSRQYGLKDFSPQNQDIAALALMAQNGSLPYVLKGDFQTAVKKSGGTWASLPSSKYAQPKRSWSELGISGGKSQPQGLTAQQQTELKRQYVDLNTLRGQKPLQREYVDLNQLQATQQPSRQFIDLNALRNQGD